MKPDFNHAEEFTSAGAVQDFIKAHYDKYTVRTFPGENSMAWYRDGHSIGFYCSNTGKGYAFWPAADTEQAGEGTKDTFIRASQDGTYKSL